jgi:SagB-type dehydrogenase family enzyme
MMVKLITLVSISLVFLLSACNARKQTEATNTNSPATPSPNGEGITSRQQMIDLPSPRLKGTLSLEESLSQRRSVREFSDQQLSLAEIGQLLWAAQGLTNPSGYRTAPSAGALYPLEVYVITPEAMYHYDPQGHRLTFHTSGDLRPELYNAALQQEPVLKAPAVFVIAAVYQRTEQKYGAERSPRYVQIEAGHATQNLLLQAVALELGAVPIGAFYDDEIKTALSLPDDQVPLYLIPVGHPME